MRSTVSIIAISIILTACSQNKAELDINGYTAKPTVDQSKPLATSRYENKGTILATTAYAQPEAEAKGSGDIRPSLEVTAKPAPVAINKTVQQLPLQTVLTAIVPTGLQVVYDENFNPQRTVEYKAGEDWRIALRAIGKANDIDFFIAADRLLVSSSVLTTAAMTQNGASGTPMVIVNGNPAQSDFVQGEVKFWARKGTNLQRTLEHWSPYADGWDVHYKNSLDIPIEADFPFDGPFEVAVRSLLNALISQGVKLKPTFFHQSKDIVIRADLTEGY